MAEYYKLSLLRKTDGGSEWEKIYFGIDDEKLEIIIHVPQKRSPLNSKLEMISEEEIKETLKDLSIDWGHG